MVDSPLLGDGSCGYGGADGCGDPGDCGCVEGETDGSQGCPSAPGPKTTSSSSGLVCCWPASVPCWKALLHSPATQPNSTETQTGQTRYRQEIVLGVPLSETETGKSGPGLKPQRLKTMKVILEMKIVPLTHFIWSRTLLLEWWVIAVV